MRSPQPEKKDSLLRRSVYSAVAKSVGLMLATCMVYNMPLESMVLVVMLHISSLPVGIVLYYVYST